MTEIDFDELDKAVNSLMADVSKPNAPAPTPSSLGSSTSTSLDSTSTSTTTPSAPVATSIDSKPAAPSLATKRRGQFMDIVRPTGSKPAPMPAHRQGVTIAPSTLASVTTTQEPVGPSIDDTTTVASVEPFESTSTQVRSDDSTAKVIPASDVSVAPADESEWPDPIDFASNKGPESGEPQVTDDQETSATPLESPFLPDAKPEKRPLDALSAADEAGMESESQELATDEKEGASTEPTRVDLPAELHDSVVAIESESTAETIPTVDEAPVETGAPVEKDEKEESPVKQSTDVPAGGSIPQQYQEQPNTGDQTNGSIYDTANYHKAIEAHATGGKKSSALKMVIWALLLLVVGAGVGAGVFMLTR